MRRPLHVMDVFLQPGEYYLGDENTRIRTILGSCVSATFWHKERLLGGMSHIILPERPLHEVKHSGLLNAKYADEAIALLITEMKSAGTLPRDYQVKLFGGGNMFPQSYTQKKSHIGLKNIITTRNLLKQHGFNCQIEHTGGLGHRYIIFDVWTGHVWLKHQTQQPSRPFHDEPAVI